MSEIFNKKTVYGTMLGGGDKARLNPKTNPRIMLEFDEALDAARLEQAMAQAAKVCPYMLYSMEKCDGGLCYKENTAPLKLFKQGEEPDSFDCDADNHHLLHVVYGGNKLTLGLSHGLTDGGGMQWFLDALLRAYFGLDGVKYDGVGAEDYAADLMEKPLPVSSNYLYKNPVPNPIYRLPEAGMRKYFLVNIIGTMVFGSKKTYRREMVLDKAALKNYCNQNNCSVSVAMSVMLAEAVMRVHPENKKAITVRMPVNTRNVLKVPNTFQNASMPQAAFEMLPEELKNAKAQTIAKVSTSLKDQLTYDTMAFLTNYFGHRASGDKTKQTGPNAKAKVLSTLDTTLFVSNMGETVPAELAGKLKNIEVVAEGGMPIMLYIVSCGDKMFISVAQNFENPCYTDALKQIFKEYGLLL